MMRVKKYKNIYLCKPFKKLTMSIKKLILKPLLVLFAVVLSAYTTTDSKNINVAESVINWVGYKVTGQHEGTISLLNGSLNFKGNTLVGGKFAMDMTTINTTDLEGNSKKKLDGHLKADDFFGVNNFKTATLVFTSVNKSKLGYAVVGDMTIKGITNEVSFVLTLTENSASTNLKIDRTKYGIKYGSASFFDGIKDKAIYDEFDLNVKLKF
jgi:polyisoprenoid-binding protein YceI